jgi:CheY-like chemotaxis protein
MKSDWTAGFQDKGGHIISEPLTPSKLYEELSRGILKKPGFRTREPRPEFKHIQVLIVDDVPVNCQIVESYLAFFGVKSSSANTGDQALNQIRRRRFDLVLMDLHLDGETGQDVALRIRAEAGIKQPLIAALSASIAEDDRASARAAGMEAYLTKPVLPGDIELLLREYFSEQVGFGGAESAATPESSLPDAPSLPGFISRDHYKALFSHDPALFWRCVRSFLASSRDMIEGLDQCLQSRDEEQLREVAHRIKGASANLADARLQDLAGHVEQSGLSGGVDSPQPERLLLHAQRTR